ncbi:hypothetical protein JCM10914A_39260 [Paenibacillus sp. JCM 10914]|uniref:DUF5359 family protein n=1 Tax=Paenibacillus sp. JCM 10914 TaxID=1236974 RepID=UPI0003CC5EE1|nr:DUF5359 family protein [Paenibacillus sp. JCM 10914]GAE04648.1 hypothetical protein JCM10914_703 [Paenibacillus sp. JCM 10914]
MSDQEREWKEDEGQAPGEWFGTMLLKLIIGLGIVLVITQLLLHYEPSRHYISPVQQMEGVPLNERNVNDWMGEDFSLLLHHSS